MEVFSNYFPEKYERIQHYFKYNINVINSENKQIQMFVVILDIILSSMNEDDKKSSNKEEMNFKHISVLDAIYVDFCKHISINSNHVN